MRCSEQVETGEDAVLHAVEIGHDELAHRGCSSTSARRRCWVFSILV
jgi:hypothetical protein